MHINEIDPASVRPLSGICDCSSYDDEFDDRYGRNNMWRHFWAKRFIRRQEVALDKNGKIVFNDRYWGDSIQVYKQKLAEKEKLEELVRSWREPTISDVIKDSKRQLKEGIPLHNQRFVVQVPKQYMKLLGVKYIGRKLNDYFDEIDIPMQQYLAKLGIKYNGEYCIDGIPITDSELYGH